MHVHEHAAKFVSRVCTDMDVTVRLVSLSHRRIVFRMEIVDVISKLQRSKLLKR